MPFVVSQCRTYQMKYCPVTIQSSFWYDNVNEKGLMAYKSIRFGAGLDQTRPEPTWSSPDESLIAIGGL